MEDWKNWSGIQKRIALCGFCGGLAASLFAVLLTVLFEPALMNDGQYGMVFSFTFSLGWLLLAFPFSFFKLRRAAFAKPNLEFILLGAFVLVLAAPLIMGLLFIPVALFQELNKLRK